MLADAAVGAPGRSVYAARYRTPRENPARVAIRIELDRILSSRL